MITLSDVQAHLGILRVSSYCPTSPEFIDLVNTAQRRAMRRGDWMGTVVPVYVCVYNGCVVWPRYVQAVRKINHCHQPIQVRNLWYEFMDGMRPHGSWMATTPWGAWHYDTNSFLSQQGRSSVFQDIQGDGRLVRAYPRCPQDVGKTVTIFGTDNNGQPIQTNNKGTYGMGTTITMANPFGSTSMFVRHIDYVLKDKTECPVNLYAYNASTDLLEDLAQYDPSETRPSYERTQLTAPGRTSAKGVVALVKLKYIPAQDPTDLILIDNLDALQLLIQSIKKGEAGDRNEAKVLEMDAIAELNRDIEDQSPDAQFAAANNVFGGTTFGQQCF